MEPSRTEIAENFELWGEYVDPSATMTEAEFDALTLEEKLQIQQDCFGEEIDQDDPEQEDEIANTPECATTINLRSQILEIVELYGKPGEDWDSALFDGGPKIITPTVAKEIAEWLEESASEEWGEDERYQRIAEGIRDLIAQDSAEK